MAVGPMEQEEGVSTQRYVSNELIHFVGRKLATDDQRYALFEKILTTGWLIAPGTIDVDSEPNESRLSRKYNWDRKVSDTEGMFRASAVCFCDIPIADLSIHIRKYSRFGVAFKKTFLISKGAAPVFYLPKGTRLFGRPRAELLDEMGDELKRMHPPIPQGAEFYRPPELSKADRFLEDIVLAYVKPFDETVAEDDPDNYYMEREWRTLTSVQFTLEDVYRVIIPQSYAHRFRCHIPMYEGQVNFVT